MEGYNLSDFFDDFSLLLCILYLLLVPKRVHLFTQVKKKHPCENLFKNKVYLVFQNAICLKFFDECEASNSYQIVKKC
jgi:hypothetical protein